MNRLLNSWFHDTTSALVHSLAREHIAPNRPALAPPHNDLTRFVLSEHARLADYLRSPLLAATLGFDLARILLNGCRFHSLPPDVRARQIAAWKSSGLGFKRNLVKYFESLA